MADSQPNHLRSVSEQDDSFDLELLRSPESVRKKGMTHYESQGPAATKQEAIDAIAMGFSPIPVVGDVLGLAADAHRFATDPESRTPLGYGLSALGALPFVPPLGTVKRSLSMAQAARMRRANKLDYNLDAYHGTRSPADFDTFETGNIYDDAGEYLQSSSGDPNSLLGPHFAKDPATGNKFAEGTGADWLRNRFSEGEGRVMPMKLKGTNVKKFKDEDELNRFIYEQPSSSQTLEELSELHRGGGEADDFWRQYDRDVDFRIRQNKRAVNRENALDEPSQETASDLADGYRAKLEQDGVTAVEYPNMVEGGTSYISIAPPRSRFAKFDPKKSKSERFMD